MIGYTLENGNAHIFFESGDLNRLKKGRIEGQYVNAIFSSLNLKSVEEIGRLEVELTSGLKDIVKISDEDEVSKNFRIRFDKSIFNDLSFLGFGGVYDKPNYIIFIDITKIEDSEPNARYYINAYKEIRSRIKQ